MIFINWPIVLTTTGLLYILMLITLPFNPVYATVLLFTLIAFWSRLPGVGIAHPFLILWVADLVDFFSLIIAVNLSGFAGGSFSLFCNLWARLCGFMPTWRFTLEDAGTMFAACLIIPFLYPMLGNDIFVAMIVFTVIRAILLIPINFLLYPGSFIQWIIEWSVGISAILVINGAYAKFFGNFFNNMLAKGFHFSWPLFFFATIVIIAFYFALFGRNDDRSASVKKTVKGIIRNQVKRIRKKKAPKHAANDELEEMKRIKDSL